MSWSTLPAPLRELAERVCTEKELEAIKLWDAGAGHRRVGLMLGISPSTARDRVRRGVEKIARAAAAEGMTWPGSFS